MNNADKTRLLRGLQGAAPTLPPARRKVATATSRDTHPTRGAASIMQAATAGAARPRTTSLNVARGAGNPQGAQGTLGRAFSWGVPGFGWGQGEFE